MLKRQSEQQHCQRQRTQTLHDSRRGKAEEVTTVRHIGRMNDQRLVKIVMLGMVEGDRSRRRPARRWSDDIRDWC